MTAQDAIILNSIDARHVLRELKFFREMHGNTGRGGWCRISSYSLLNAIDRYKMVEHGYLETKAGKNNTLYRITDKGIDLVRNGEK